jgi:hypothetical protein
MNHKLVKKHLTRYVLLAGFALLLALAIGTTIFIEGWHLLVAPTITSEEQLATSFEEYKYVNLQTDELQYTDIDMIFEHPNMQKRFKGYISKLNERYIFVFSQDNVEDLSKMIIMPSYFSEGNHELFKESVYEQFSYQSDISEQQVRTMFISDVYIDVTGRIKEDTSRVFVWLVGTLFIVIGLLLILFELNRFKNYKGEYAIFFNKKLTKISKNLLMSDRGFIVMRLDLKVMPFDEIIDVDKGEKAIVIYFKKHMLQVRADQELIDSIYETIFPEILTT